MTLSLLLLWERVPSRREGDEGLYPIARLDAGECMRSMTERRARELEGLGHQ
jgi:hypothetical protein